MTDADTPLRIAIAGAAGRMGRTLIDRKSTRLNSSH